MRKPFEQYLRSGISMMSWLFEGELKRITWDESETFMRQIWEVWALKEISSLCVQCLRLTHLVWNSLWVFWKDPSAFITYSTFTTVLYWSTICSTCTSFSCYFILPLHYITEEIFDFLLHYIFPQLRFRFEMLKEMIRL